MKKKRPKIFAMYLPQFHEIKENSQFWGEGFTDWVGVKNSRPLFEGHIQPKVPLHHNYYDLSRKESVKWQCETARKYGISGFAIYHYWFNDEKNLLTAPSELILKNRELDIRYFFAWDNISWVRSWTGIKGNDWYLAGESAEKEDKKPAVLVKYILGNKEQWEKHYRYVRSFFMDERYEKCRNKPVFMILNPDRKIMEMCRYWDKRAQHDGYAGIHFIYRWNSLHPKTNSLLINKEKFYYEPVYSGWGDLVSKIKENAARKKAGGKPQIYSYDKIWRNILKKAERSPGGYSGAFVRYDDTPRRGERGKAVTGESPEKFEFYLKELIRISAEKRKRYIFLTAWNEWGEGAFLEPDEKDGYAYLNAVKNAIKES